MNRDNDRVVYQAFGLLSQLSAISTGNNSSSSSSSSVPSLRLLPSFAKHLIHVVSSPERLARSHKRLRVTTISLIAAWAEELAKHRKTIFGYARLVVGVAELARVGGGNKGCGNDDVMRRAIYALNHLCGDDDDTSAPIKTQIVGKAFEDICKMMDRCVNSSDDDEGVAVLHDTLELIAKLIPACSAPLLKNENVLHRIVKVMQRYPDRLGIQEHAVATLANVMRNDKSTNALGIADKFKTARPIVVAMAHHPGSSRIVQHGCHALSSLVASHHNNLDNDNNDDDDNNATTSVTASFLPTTGSTIINGMLSHISNPRVQTAALHCLSSLTSPPSSPRRRRASTCRLTAARPSSSSRRRPIVSRDVIRRSGGRTAILLSMQVHFDRPEIQRLAFQVFTNINVDLRQHGSSSSSSSEDEIDVDNDNDDVNINAASPDDDDGNNNNDDNNTDKTKVDLLDPKELDAIVTALKIHHRLPIIQHDACALLTLYAGEQSNVWIMCENDDDRDLEKCLDVVAKREGCATKVKDMIRELLDKMEKMRLMMTMESLTVT